MPRPRYLSAEQAAKLLDVKRATLYAYVSRGLVRSVETGDGRRDRRYYAEDVERLRARREGRRDPESAAERVLHAGTPVLESAISMITDDCLYYRGHDALALAKTATVEQVAALIWLDDLASEIPEFADSSSAERLVASVRGALAPFPDLEPIVRYQVAVPLMAELDPAAFDTRRDAVVAVGARILWAFTAVTSERALPERGTAARLTAAWGIPGTLCPLVEAALILLADHELNTSTFTARCAASVAATPYGVVSAGLAAFQGTLHGGASRQSEFFIREAAQAPSVSSAVSERLKRGERIPGFGHVLYRGVDPRAALLHSLIRDYLPDAPLVAVADQVMDHVHQRLALYANVDFALGLLTQSLDLPPGSASALFAVGRTLGWIGHAIEQYALRPIIRPRARYVGRLPTESP